MSALDRGDSFIVTRNGVPVGELRPFRRRRFISAESVIALFRRAPDVDLPRLRQDLDDVASSESRRPGA